MAKASAETCEPVEAGGTTIVTAKRIARFAPQANAKITGAILAKWASAIQAQIVTPLRIQHFFATIATETNGLRRLDENLGYSADRLLAVFPTRVNRQQALALHMRPIDIANFVYGGRLGNAKPNDGWDFRGSGYIQLTGRDNFTRVGKELSLDLASNPDLVRDPEVGFAAATTFWSVRKINPLADKNDIGGLRKAVNGGTNGLASAKIFFARAKSVFLSEPTEAGEVGSANQAEFEGVKLRLEELGYLVRSPEEGFSAQQVTRALATFQGDYGIPATGVYDDDTLGALTDPMLDIHQL